LKISFFFYKKGGILWEKHGNYKNVDTTTKNREKQKKNQKNSKPGKGTLYSKPGNQEKASCTLFVCPKLTIPVLF